MLRTTWRRLYSVGRKSIAEEMQKPWRDAASLIIAAPSERTSGKFSTDYGILFVKRAAKSSAYPNAYVYPGGVVDRADKHSQWIDMFTDVDSSFCENIGSEFFVKQSDGKRPSVFPGDESCITKGILPNEIAFRIGAIRESFEESGLLLLTSDVKSRRASPDAIHAKSMTSLLSDDEVEEWRKKVHGDAREFINLCVKLQKVPDIWSLKEWFHWLSPIIPGRIIEKGRRYDTVFYSCCLQEAPSYFHHDKVETSESIWISPVGMIQMFLDKKALLAPPQIIETLRFLNFSTLQSLALHANRRALKGLERLVPYFVLTKDGKLLGFWPGDDLYPENPDVFGRRDAMEVLPETLAEIVASKRNKFNCLLDPKNPASVINSMTCNITLHYDQVTPVILRTSNDQSLARFS